MSRRGFTLVELLVVSAIFVVSVSSFTYGLRLSLKASKSATKLNKAAYLIQTEMENIKTLPFAQLLTLNGKTFAKGAGKVFVSPLLPDLVSIKTQLEWHPKKKPLETHTLRSKYE